MHNRLVSFLTFHKIIVDNQHGFRKGKSTNTAIINFLERVYESIDKKEIGIGLFLDLSKAFDLVDHTILLEKLRIIGIRGVAHSWFTSYLNNRIQRVEITHNKLFIREEIHTIWRATRFSSRTNPIPNIQGEQ